MTAVSLSLSFSLHTKVERIKTITTPLLSKNEKHVKESDLFRKYLHNLFKTTAASYTISNFKNTITTHSTKKLHRQQPVI